MDMDIRPGVGVVEVDVEFVYGSFRTSHAQYVTSEFKLLRRIRGQQDEYLEYIKQTSGCAVSVQELHRGDGASIELRHVSLEGMKKGCETLDGLLNQVVEDFKSVLRDQRLIESDVKLQKTVKSCSCPKCGRVKPNLKELEQHNSHRHEHSNRKSEVSDLREPKSRREARPSHESSRSRSDTKSDDRRGPSETRRHRFDPKTIAVRGFSADITKAELRDSFAVFGGVERIRIRNPEDGRIFAFVTFRRESGLENLMGLKETAKVHGAKQTLLDAKRIPSSDEVEVADLSNFQPESVRQIYVEGFPRRYNENDLTSFFQLYGDVKKCTLVDDVADQAQHALVTFSNMVFVEELMKEMLETRGLYISDRKLKIERTCDHIENAIRRRTEEKNRTTDDFDMELTTHSGVVEHKVGVAKPSPKLTDLKKQLDSIALQLTVHKRRQQLTQLSKENIMVLQKHWKWLSKTKTDLEAQAENEPFSILGSNELSASTLAIRARELLDQISPMIGIVADTDNAPQVETNTNPLPSASNTYGAPSTYVTPNMYGAPSTYGNISNTAAVYGTNLGIAPANVFSFPPPPLPVFPQQMALTTGVPMMYSAMPQMPQMPVPQQMPVSVMTDNVQPVDMDVADDEVDKTDAKLPNTSKNKTVWDANRISVLGFTPEIEAKDLQKMFGLYGIAKEVKIYLEHDIRYAFMTFPRQKSIKNLFKQKLGVNLELKGMKLICSRIQENKTPGFSAQLISEVKDVEQPKGVEKEMLSPAQEPDPWSLEVAFPITKEELTVFQMLANVVDLLSPPRSVEVTEEEMTEDLQERERRMVKSLQAQLGYSTPEIVVRIIKHLRCIHTEIDMQRILYSLSEDAIVGILNSTSTDELVDAIQRHADEIEEAKESVQSLNLYLLIRKMVLVMHCVMTEKRSAQGPKTDSLDSKRKTSRWSGQNLADAAVGQFIAQDSLVQHITQPTKEKELHISHARNTYKLIQERQRNIQKLLSELPSKDREKVEEAFRKDVTELRETGVVVGETEEINIYIKALGRVGRKTTKSDKKEDSRKLEKTSSSKGKDERKKIKPKESPKKVKVSSKYEPANKRKNSCNGKISLEGLNLVEKRMAIQKALSEVPSFIVARIKAKQKASLAKLKGDAKTASEAEEMKVLVEAFNFMFNEEGNIMADVLRDQVFSQNEYRIKKDATAKQLNLPQFDEEVLKFKKLDAAKQTEEMKRRRESLSVLLKVLQFKKQDDVFENAEKTGIILSKSEKNIIRFQVLLDIWHAVMKKQGKEVDVVTNEAAKTAPKFSTYEAENGDSEDEFDADNTRSSIDGQKELKSMKVKRKSDSGVPKQSVKRPKVIITEVIEISDGEDDDEKETTKQETVEQAADKTAASIRKEMSQEEAEQEIEKLFDEFTSGDEEGDVVVDDDYEAELLADMSAAVAAEEEADDGQDNLEKNGVEEDGAEIEQTDEEELEKAFREMLSPAERRSILAKTTKMKKTRLVAGNEMSDEEAAALRYQMIREALEKQLS